MRSRALTALGLSVVALALATSLAPMASAAAPGPAAVSAGVSGVSPESSAAICARNNGTPNGDGITAQDFEASFDQYDAQGAADFKIKRGAANKCRVTQVTLTGSHSTGGPSNAANVWIHKNSGGVPGTLKCSATVAAAGPSFTVPVSGCTLRRGKYWLVAQVDQTFGTAGQWFWSTTNDRVLTADLWQNPGGGFGTTCSTWGTIGSCLGAGFEAYDYLFTVEKA